MAFIGAAGKKAGDQTTDLQILYKIIPGRAQCACRADIGHDRSMLLLVFGVEPNTKVADFTSWKKAGQSLDLF